eukprot:PhM_4_TR14752/c0_g1_i1/m.78192
MDCLGWNIDPSKSRLVDDYFDRRAASEPLLVLYGLPWFVTDTMVLATLKATTVKTCHVYTDPRSGASLGIVLVEFVGGPEVTNRIATTLRSIQGHPVRVRVMYYLNSSRWQGIGRPPELANLSDMCVPNTSAACSSADINRLTSYGGLGTKGWTVRAGEVSVTNTSTEEGYNQFLAAQREFKMKLKKRVREENDGQQ